MMMPRIISQPESHSQISMTNQKALLIRMSRMRMKMSMLRMTMNQTIGSRLTVLLSTFKSPI